MAFAFGIERPLVAQSFRTFAVTLVGAAAAIPLDPGASKQNLITTFAISNPTTSGTSIFIGNAGVTAPGGANPGFEIQPGSAPAFRSFQEGRQLYELQGMLAQLVQAANCANTQLEKIPFIVFDLSTIFAFSAMNVTFTVIAFQAMYL